MNKKAILLIITAAIAISIALVLYLNSNKNKIINDLISKAIKSNTLNLYNVKYDESTVNLTNKELHFTDISIEVDSSKLSKLAELHQSPRNIFQIKIKSVTAEGIDIPLAIFENKIKANKLIIHEPEITITINKNLVEKIEDSTNFLQKLIEAIHPLNAETIDISKAKLIVINSNKNIILRVANLNISLLKFSTDSPHNYSNSSRHFAYKVNTNIEQINLYPEINNKEIQLENISWDAVEKTILIEKFLVKNEEKLNVPNVIHSIKIEGIDMEECLYKKNIHISNITAKTCKFSI
jgi:hypothetical protein